MKKNRSAPKKLPPRGDPLKLLARSLLLPVFGTGSRILAIETTFNLDDPLGLSCFIGNPEGYSQMVGDGGLWRPASGLVRQVTAEGSLTTDDGRQAELTLHLALEQDTFSQIAAFICASSRFGRPLLAHYKGSSHHLENIRFLFELLSESAAVPKENPRGLGAVLLGRTTANLSLLSASSPGIPVGKKIRTYLEDTQPHPAVFEIDLKA